MHDIQQLSPAPSDIVPPEDAPRKHVRGFVSLRVIDDLPAMYPALESWWKGHGWPAVPLGVLPRLGVLAEQDGNPLAAGWLYMDNSCGVCMLEWLVTNPAAAPRQAAVALARVVDFLKAEAKDTGYLVMLATCRQPSLSRLLVASGFEETDRDVIHLITIL